MYEVLISHEAAKSYRKQDTKTKQRLNRCIERISQDPLSDPHVKRLHGPLQGKLRYAMGGLRIVYTVDADKQIVSIVSIKNRGEAYK